MLVNSPSVLTKSCCFRDHKSDVEARVYEYRWTWDSTGFFWLILQRCSLAPSLVRVGARAACLPGRRIRECEVPQGVVSVQEQVLPDKIVLNISCLINKIH